MLTYDQRAAFEQVVEPQSHNSSRPQSIRTCHHEKLLTDGLQLSNATARLYRDAPEMSHSSTSGPNSGRDQGSLWAALRPAEVTISLVLWTPGLRNCVERCAPRYVYPLLAIAKSSLVESLGEPWAFLVVAGGDRHDAPAIAGGGRSPRADVAAG